MKSSKDSKIPGLAAPRHSVFYQRLWPNLHCTTNPVFNITSFPSACGSRHWSGKLLCSICSVSSFTSTLSISSLTSVFGVQCSIFSVSSFTSTFSVSSTTSVFGVRCSIFSVSSFINNQQSSPSGKSLAIAILLWNDPAFEYYEPILEPTGYQMRKAPKQQKLPADNLTFNIYPNPARDYFTVTWEIPSQPNLSASVIVTDAMGRELKVKSLPSASGEMMVDIATLPKGVFNVWLVSNKKPVANRKLVVIN